MFRSDADSTKSSDDRSSIFTNSYEELSECEPHFEKPKLTNFEITVFVERLITIFEKLMSQLEFAVRNKIYNFYTL